MLGRYSISFLVKKIDMAILTINNLKKSFDEKEVLSGVNLLVPEHSIFGFVGRNGAGKTTTMKAVLGLLPIDGGEIFVNGEKVSFGNNKTKKIIGYLPDVPEFYPFMTAREYLTLCGDCQGIAAKILKFRVEELLELVGLSKEKAFIKGYSRGMKQRLGVAQALIGEPKLLICDEPTSALDPVGRKEILDLLSSIKEKTTVLFSSHILSDVDRICTDVALLEDGKIKVAGRLEEIKRQSDCSELIIKIETEADRLKFLSAFEANWDKENDTLILLGGEAEFYRALYFIANEKITVRKIERNENSLERIFFGGTKP